MAAGLFDGLFAPKKKRDSTDADAASGASPGQSTTTNDTAGADGADVSVRETANTGLFATTAGPRTFTIPAHANFIDALAAGILAHRQHHDLPDWTILLPTRRAGRALAQALRRMVSDKHVDGSDVILLPKIVPLGDAEDIGPGGALNPSILALAPPVSRIQRQCELAQLLTAKARAQGEPLDPAGGLALAETLAEIIDEACEYDALIAKAEPLFAHLPQHLQDAGVFLKIIQDVWPARLDELDRLDPGAHQAARLRALAQSWSENPPPGPVLVAGSTGSAPATADLLAAIAHLPQGALVLPGLDTGLDDAAWDKLDDQHPQATLKRLLARLKISRTDVMAWPATTGAAAGVGSGDRGPYEGAKPASKQAPEQGGTRNAHHPGEARLRLINEALRPADATADWLERLEELGADTVRKGLAGLTVMPCPDEATHARAIGLAVRHALEQDPHADVVIVTPDRALGLRIETALRRWNIEADHSAGQPFPETPAGGFLLQILAFAAAPGDAAALCALVKHRLTQLGFARPRLRDVFAKFEVALRRGRLSHKGQSVHDMADHLALAELDENGQVLAGLAQVISAALSPLQDLSDAHAPVADFARALAEVAEAFTQTNEPASGTRVWAGPDGREAAGLIRTLMEETQALGEVTLPQFVRVFAAFAGGVSVRPPVKPAGVVRILGPLEARLMSGDLVILAGLNEGVWPKGLSGDPFLSAGMRQAAGLPPRERRIGQSAHDFAQAACAPRVMLTWSQRVDGAPAVPSRWIWRLQTLCRAAGVDADVQARSGPDNVSPDNVTPDFVALAQKLDARETVLADFGGRSGNGPDPDHIPLRPKALAPHPCPPLEARPRHLSVTRIKHLIRDPYAIFARDILKLSPLDPLNEPLGPRERGIALHAAMAELPDDLVGEALGTAFAASAETALLAHGLPRQALAVERPALAKIARWLAVWSQRWSDAGWGVAAREVSGTLTVDAPGGAFTLSARADRIDIGPAGTAVLDYKTGNPPTRSQVESGLEPQVSLEGVIAAQGGFDGIKPDHIAALTYIRLGGPAGGHELMIGEGDTAQELSKTALDGLERLIAIFDDPATPYVSHKLPLKRDDRGDYDQLARRGEWSRAGDDAQGQP